MTVKELIETLKAEYPLDAEIFVDVQIDFKGDSDVLDTSVIEILRSDGDKATPRLIINRIKTRQVAFDCLEHTLDETRRNKMRLKLDFSRWNDFFSELANFAKENSEFASAILALILICLMACSLLIFPNWGIHSIFVQCFIWFLITMFIFIKIGHCFVLLTVVIIAISIALSLWCATLLFLIPIMPMLIFDLMFFTESLKFEKSEN